MALKPIGAVFGTVGSSAFRIAVSDNTLRRNDYIKVEHPTCGWVLGQVVDLQREWGVEEADISCPETTSVRVSTVVVCQGRLDGYEWTGAVFFEDSGGTFVVAEF